MPTTLADFLNQSQDHTLALAENIHISTNDSGAVELRRDYDQDPVVIPPHTIPRFIALLQELAP